MTARDLGSFYVGLLRPLFVPAHLLALLALGLFIAQQKYAHRRTLLILFAAAQVAAFLAVLAAAVVINAQLYLLAAAAVTGTLIAIARPLPLLLSAPLALIGGAAFEFDAVPQEISMRTSALMLAGSAFSAFAIVALVAVLTAGAKPVWFRTGMRIVGSWAAAIALLVLALQFARSGG